MHLGPLSNEVFFKKAFSDREVLENFVEDVSGERIQFDKIDTEYQFTPPVGGVDIRYDIFAESTDGRVIVELQRIRYDSHFDRFLAYFCASLLEQIRSHMDYSIQRKVITIVMLTSPYRRKENGDALIEDSVLISNLDPRTLSGKVRHVFGHQLIFLNPHYNLAEVPDSLAAWLRLVKLSLDGPTLENESELIAKLQSTDGPLLRAAHLTLWDGLTAAERTAAINATAAEKAATTYVMERDEAIRRMEGERLQKEEQRRLKEEERRQKEDERQQKEAALAENEILREKLKAMGIELPE